MRLLFIAILAVAACSLYEDTSSTITRGSTAPDAGNHNCGNDGGSPYPDAYLYPDGGYWIDDAPNFDGGSYWPDAPNYVPDAYVGPVDAGHGH